MNVPGEGNVKECSWRRKCKGMFLEKEMFRKFPGSS